MIHTSGNGNVDDGPGGGGLDNLFALAHLAAMTEQERGASSRSPERDSPLTTATAETAAAPSNEERDTAAAAATSVLPADGRNAQPSPDTQRPAKKRAVPADFDAESQGGDVAVSQQPSPPIKSPETDRTASAASKPSTPAAKRYRRTKKQQRKGSNTFKMKANQPSFPAVLMGILSAPQNKEFITFLSDGTSFIIVQPEALSSHVLPIHFEDNVPTYDQFLYLLSIWGFDVINDPRYPQVNVYKHPQFRRGDWEACLEIKLPSLEQVEEVNRRIAAPESQKGGQASEGTDSSSSSRRDDADRVHPSLTAARSVTPQPMSEMMNVHAKLPHLKDAALLKLVAASRTAAAQTNDARQQFSNLGPKFSSMEKNAMYRQLLQDSMGGNQRMHGVQEHGVQGHSALLLQTGLLSSTSLGSNRSSMMGYSNNRRATFDVPHPSMLGSLGSMPRNRRATIDMPPTFMMLQQTGLLSNTSLGNNRSSTMGYSNHRRATFDVPHPSMLGSLDAMRRNRRATLDMPPPPSSLLMGNNNINAMMSCRNNMSPSFLRGQGPQPMQGQTIGKGNGALSNTEVNLATEDIVSAAINALHPARAQGGLTENHPPAIGIRSGIGGISRLDAMTDLFLERSRARLSSRPVSLMGPNAPGILQTEQQRSEVLPRREWQSTFSNSLAASVGAEVEDRTKACLAATAAARKQQQHLDPQRKVSILGSTSG